MRVLAVDPGTTTGIVSVILHEHLDPVVESFGDHSLSYLMQNLRHIIKGHNTVVIEDMIKTGRITDGKIDQIKAIGLVEQQALLRYYNLYYIQPSESKMIKEVPKFITDHHSRDAYKVFKAWSLKEKI